MAAMRVGQDDAELLGKLRALRAKLAKKKRCGRKVYKIFHDKTLLEIASSRPTTRDELLAVHGIGERKVEQFGDAVLEVVRTFAVG